MKELMRTDVFNPYIDGPKFTLKLYNLNQKDWNWGKWILGYEFYQDDELIFSGQDFHCSPMYAIDSYDSAMSLMGFLTLRPGDTDSEYFDEYTTRQLEFCDEHAETLAMYPYDHECNY